MKFGNILCAIFVKRNPHFLGLAICPYLAYNSSRRGWKEGKGHEKETCHHPSDFNPRFMRVPGGGGPQYGGPTPGDRKSVV